MRGDELAVWIFREHPQTRVIFMSANPLCMCDVNPAICIEKPFSLRDLDTAVRVTLALDANEWGVVS